MTTAEHLVALPPQGLVIALGYWSGDIDQAMRLARLIGAIEPRRREDVVFAFCPRFDVEWDAAQQATFMEVGKRFGVCRLTQRPPHATGHPGGPNAMFASTLGQLSEAWRDGKSQAHSVFLCEADGCPLRADWIDRLRAAHEQALRAGKRVTGCLMDRGVFPHINGSLIAHLSLWLDHPSLRETPSPMAWDLFHAVVLTSEARPTGWIKNLYGAGNWSPESMATLSRECAWLSSCKDGSAIEWAERTLVATRAVAGKVVSVNDDGSVTIER